MKNLRIDCVRDLELAEPLPTPYVEKTIEPPPGAFTVDSFAPREYGRNQSTFAQIGGRL
jgi:hypothetical protein